MSCSILFRIVSPATAHIASTYPRVSTLQYPLSDRLTRNAILMYCRVVRLYLAASSFGSSHPQRHSIYYRDAQSTYLQYPLSDRLTRNGLVMEESTLTHSLAVSSFGSSHPQLEQDD